MNVAQIQLKSNGHLTIQRVIEYCGAHSDAGILGAILKPNLGILSSIIRDYMSTSILAGIGDLPCFTNFCESLVSLFVYSLILIFLLHIPVLSIALKYLLLTLEYTYLQ